MKFGRLTVVSKAMTPEYYKSKKTFWLCICDCGNEKTINGVSLTAGHTKSCGCLQSEIQSKLHTTHGLSDTRFYGIWSKMKFRCHNQEYSEFHLYGGRGISVSEEWHTFENFMNDMYADYQEFEKLHGENSASIDRIDPDGNYSKENCKWASELEQARNRRNNISVIIDGVKFKTLTEVAGRYGISYSTVIERYNAGKRGVELIVKVKHRGNTEKTGGIQVEVNGVEYLSLTALQKDYPYISLVSISKRYKKGIRGAELIAPPIGKKTTNPSA